MEHKILSHMRTLIIIAAIAFCYAGCDRLVDDVTPPKVESKLVLFTFLSPENDFTEIELTRSKPVFGNTASGSNIDFIRNAVVTITNNDGVSATLQYVDSLDAYAISQAAYPIVPQKTYKVTATVNGKQVFGETTIPLNNIPFAKVDYIRIGSNDPNYFGPQYRYSYTWNDKAGEKNYYRVSVQTIQNYTSFDSSFSDSFLSPICDNLFEDLNRDGDNFGGSCEDFGFYQLEDSTTQTISVFLLNTDIHYYEYHRRRLNYFGEDPFSEPFPQYSNINGGLGVVCSFRKYRSDLLIMK
jgi:hypothetical protein